MRPRIAGCFALFSVFFVAALIPKEAAQSPDLARQFESPPPQFGPSCFWWWFGCPYSARDIHESLDAIKAAGLGRFPNLSHICFPSGETSSRR